jgi:hypothetical protein
VCASRLRWHRLPCAQRSRTKFVAFGGTDFSLCSSAHTLRSLPPLPPYSARSDPQSLLQRRRHGVCAPMAWVGARHAPLLAFDSALKFQISNLKFVFTPQTLTPRLPMLTVRPLHPIFLCACATLPARSRQAQRNNRRLCCME